MEAIFSSPAFWLFVLVLSGPGLEWLPPLRRFRVEQSKRPRFDDTPCSMTVEIIILLGWIGPLVSFVAALLCFSNTTIIDIFLMLLVFAVICVVGTGPEKTI